MKIFNQENQMIPIYTRLHKARPHGQSLTAFNYPKQIVSLKLTLISLLPSNINNTYTA